MGEEKNKNSNLSSGSLIEGYSLTVGKKEIIEKGNEETVLTLEGVKDEISKATDKVLDDAKKEIANQSQLDKASLITVFGIFASVISFLTIEFQFLKTMCSFEKILGFTLVLFALLFGFNIGLDYLIKSRFNGFNEEETPDNFKSSVSKNSVKPCMCFSIFVLVLLGIGILFVYKGNEEICRDKKIYERYSDQFEENFNELNKTIEDRLKEQDKKIDAIKNP